MKRKFGKRGISNVVYTIIMIVLTLVAVTIIWGVVNNIITNQSEKIAIDSLTIDVEIQSVKIEGENISVKNKNQKNI